MAKEVRDVTARGPESHKAKRTNGGLGDLRVLELGSLVSAPFCGKLLADLGAEVVKVEDPRQPDPARALPPFVGENPRARWSVPFVYLNTNKFGVTLDLSKAPGRKLFLELLRDCDIIVDNHPPAWLRKLGLSNRAVRRVNPRLVFVSITPFGHAGPYASHKANDFIVNHASGIAYTNGARARDLVREPPVQLPCNLASFYAGLVAATAAMSAVFTQQVTGAGTWIDISMQEVLASNVRVDLAVLAYTGAIPSRAAQAVMNNVIFCQQPTADGYVDFVIRREHQWRSLLEILGNPDWGNWEVFRDMLGRTNNWEALDPLLGEATSRFAKQELYERCQALRVTAAPVNSLDEATRVEQFRQRGVFVQVETKNGSHCSFPGPPIRFSDIQWGVRSPAPALGEHNSLIIGERLGYSKDMDRLKARGII